MTNTHDPVNHPKHYTSHPSGVECIDVTRHMSFNLGNVVKYLWRSGLKDGAPTIQDLEKAAWYLNDEIGKMKKAATGMRYANDVKSNIDEVAAQINAAVNPPIEVKTTEHPIEEVADEWDSNRVWNPNDAVRWGGTIYRMVSSTLGTTQAPHRSLYWTKIES